MREPSVPELASSIRSPLLQVEALSKSFPGVRALDEVSLEVFSGEVVAVVGHNGSGKSTLVKVLAGLYEPDPGGQVFARTAEGAIVQGSEARDALHIIHQDLGLIGNLSTIENLDLGRRHGLRSLLPAPSRDERRRASELVAQFGASFDVRAPIASLPPAARTVVAIARALDGWTRPDNMLILDEPTATLRGEEVALLFGAVRRTAKGGAGVIFISHRLDEVVNLADRVLVLRDGRLVAALEAGEYDHETLVNLITGGAAGSAAAVEHKILDDPVLRVRGLSGETVVRADLDIRPGEIVGVSGVVGSGREAIGGLIFGALRRTSGEVELGDRSLPPGRLRAAIAAGVGYVPADRHSAGAVMSFSVRENVTLPQLRPLRRRLGRLDLRQERREAISWLGRVGLRPLVPERALSLFSGGNQQKAVLAKWLRNEPRLLLLDEPTQGVDVGAKASIYELVVGAAGRGAAVLISSSDTEELLSICNRVLVFREGEVVATLEGEDLTDHRLVMESLGLGRAGAEIVFGDTEDC